MGLLHKYRLVLHGTRILNHAKQRQDSKTTQSAKPIDTGNRGKRRLDPPSGDKAEKRRAAITHWPCWLEREPVATLQEETPGTYWSSATSKKLSTSHRASLNTNVQTPFLRSLMLRTSAGMMNALSSSPSRKIVGQPTLSTKTQTAFQSPGLQVMWICEQYWCSRKDC